MSSCDTWHKLKWKMNASSVFLNSVNLHYLHNCRRWSSTLICHAWSLTILYAICSANVFYCLLLDATHRGMEQIMLTGWRIAFVFYSSAGSEKKNSHKGSSSYCRWLTTYSHAKKKNGILNIMQRVGGEMKVGRGLWLGGCRLKVLHQFRQEKN